MLGRLMKYDLKWEFKPLIVFYILALFFSILARGLSNIENSLIFNIITQICYGSAIIMMINIIINSLMRCWVRFLRNIYKDEAYLTHTLPVNKKDIFLSKILTGFIVILISSIIILICLAICYYSQNNIEIIKGLFSPMTSLIGENYIFYILTIIFMLILEFAFMLMAGYLGIILGHKSNNFKIVKSVIYGFLAFILVSLTTLVLMYIIGLFNNDIMNMFNTVELPSKNSINILLFGGLAIYIIYILIYYGVGRKLLKNGVDVE